MEELLCAQLPFWGNLTNTEKPAVTENSSLIHVKKGQIINAGSCLGLVYLQEGRVRTFLLSPEGREVTLFYSDKGDSCVLSASCVISQISFEVHMIAEENCDILLVPSGIFGSLAENNIYVRCFMYEHLSDRFSSVMWVFQQILFKKMDVRLSEYLLREYERTGTAKIKTTQEQIALSINSAREVVARMLKRFSDEKLVEAERGIVLLKDISGLRAIQ